MRAEAKRKSNSQLERFHRETVDLIKRYQFRDRKEMTCSGLSVSQCYVIEALQYAGSQSMNELAGRMRLSVSTLTRVVDELVAKRLVTRREDERDRRFRVVSLTGKGHSAFRAAWKSVFASEKAILEGFPPEQRESLIRLLHELNQAAEHWQSRPSRGQAAGRRRAKGGNPKRKS